jgi:hypothetical protein
MRGLLNRPAVDAVVLLVTEGVVMVREWVGVTLERKRKKIQASDNSAIERGGGDEPSHLIGVGLMSCFGTPTDNSGLSMLVSFDLVELGGVPLVGVTSNAGLLVDGTLLLLAVVAGLTHDCGRGTGDGSSE